MKKNKNNKIPNPNPIKSSTRDDDEQEDPILTPSSTTDICRALTDRYAKSKAPQHRHLIATAAALKSILIEEGLPLTPPAYLAAAVTAFRDSDRSDPQSISAVSSLLSILLLSVDSAVLPPAKAKNAAFMVARFLGEGKGCGLATGTVRSLVKSLGMLVMLVDLEDWNAVELPLRTLLVYAVDKRPKVRKCAHECVEKVFKSLHSPFVLKNGSKAILSMYKKFVPLAEQQKSAQVPEEGGDKIQSVSEHLEALHMFNMLTVIAPSLSEKVRMKIIPTVYKLLGCSFSSCTRHILRLLEVLVGYLDVDDLVSDSENILFAVISYISTVDNPIDTIISALVLLKNALKKLHNAQPSLWINYLPPAIASVAGYLSSDADSSKQVENILKELIDVHIKQKPLTSARPLCRYENDTPEVIAITSICTVFDQMLGACDIPSENMLAVISVLFLTLGKFSFFVMKEIFLKLSQKTIDLKEESPNKKHLEACIGAAVIAMGPENVLSLVPISLDVDKVTCSNTWMLPLLKKYVTGASLHYFLEHIIPLAESVQNAFKKVKKQSRLRDLQTCFHSLWGLLPAFCRYPTDTSRSFDALSKLLIASLKENPSLHETIGKAVQELVNGNKNFLKTNQGAKPWVDLPSNFIFNDTEARTPVSCYSEKTALKNVKTLACGSMDLFQVLTDIFFDSPPERHAFLKEAIGSLASILGSEKVNHFFVNSLKKCVSEDASVVSENLKDKMPEEDIEEGSENMCKSKGCVKRRCLMIKLTSSFIDVADEDLTDIIFNFVKTFLVDTDGICQAEAYYALSRILEVHSWFCQARTEELVDFLFAVKISTNDVIIKNRFSCLHHLLVHILKRDDEDLNTKAFLILNEIIVTLKTKKESRKLAYDMLLHISSNLKDTQATERESDLQRLLNMVMGYLSSSSPHIMSGAISALSLLIYNDAKICITVPNLIPSVLTLLQNKATEVIKAALGFIKVLASSLDTIDLIQFLSDILNGILPWSAVSKFHFRSKVGVILEILIRKCGTDAIRLVAPDKYKGFIKTIDEGRQRKKNPGLGNSETETVSVEARKNGGEKRRFNGPPRKHLKATSGNLHKGKKWKQQDASNTNRTGGSVGRKQAPKGASKVSRNSYETQSKGWNNKRKRNVEEKSIRGNKMGKTEGKKYDSNKHHHHHASAASGTASFAGGYKKRKRNVDEKPKEGNKKVRIAKQKEDSNKNVHHTSASTKSSRTRRKSVNHGAE